MKGQRGDKAYGALQRGKRNERKPVDVHRVLRKRSLF